MPVVIDITLAQKVLDTVDQGLVRGLGEPTPGKMCVEAAVCYALGEPHNDSPSCVHSVVRRFKIGINDAPWSSNTARTEGMRRIAVAQLGSLEIDPVKFVKYVSEQTIRRILPSMLRQIGLTNEALRCEQAGDEAAADAAYAARTAAAAAARAAAADDAADEILNIATDIGVEALQLCGAEGVNFLYLCEVSK